MPFETAHRTYGCPCRVIATSPECLFAPGLETLPREKHQKGEFWQCSSSLLLTKLTITEARTLVVWTLCDLPSKLTITNSFAETLVQAAVCHTKALDSWLRWWFSTMFEVWTGHCFGWGNQMGWFSKIWVQMPRVCSSAILRAWNLNWKLNRWHALFWLERFCWIHLQTY